MIAAKYRYKFGLARRGVGSLGFQINESEIARLMTPLVKSFQCGRVRAFSLLAGKTSLPCVRRFSFCGPATGAAASTAVGSSANKETDWPEVPARFAPFGTGNLRIGGARAALFNSLFARDYSLQRVCAALANGSTTQRRRRKKKAKKESARTKLVQPETRRVLPLEAIVQRDAFFRFLIKAKEFLAKQPEQILQLDEAGKLHRELGFPRGRKVARSIERHPAIFRLYRHTDGKMWFGFTSLMEDLLQEERRIMDSMESSRLNIVRKLLMMSANKRIAMSKIHHCRLLFGIPDDFRDRVVRYPGYFKVVAEDGKRMLELVHWDPDLAISQLESDFILDEDRVRKAFTFPVSHAPSLNLGKEGTRKLNRLNSLPLVSPYSDNSDFKLWSPEAEKYRVGVLHEFLNLTLEKRASIHHIVEFKDEFRLTKHTYQMLLKQARTFYLAGTEMNWTVFLRDAYKDGELIEKDPQVTFNEKLYNIASTQKHLHGCTTDDQSDEE